MPPNQEPEIREEDVHNPHVGFEASEADLRVVLGFLAALGLATAMILIVLWGMFTYFRNRSAQWAPLPSPQVYSSPPKIPRPVLQPDPVADYNVYRLTEQQLVNSYGWVDQKEGTVRIPIDRAMDLLVQRGLPWKAPGTGAAPTGENPNPATGAMPGAQRLQEDLTKNKK